MALGGLESERSRIKCQNKEGRGEVVKAFHPVFSSLFSLGRRNRETITNRPIRRSSRLQNRVIQKSPTIQDPKPHIAAKSAAKRTSRTSPITQYGMYSILLMSYP